jgi:hypothetical protein
LSTEEVEEVEVLFEMEQDFGRGLRGLPGADSQLKATIVGTAPQ